MTTSRLDRAPFVPGCCFLFLSATTSIRSHEMCSLERALCRGGRGRGGRGQCRSSHGGRSAKLASPESLGRPEESTWPSNIGDRESSNQDTRSIRLDGLTLSARSRGRGCSRAHRVRRIRRASSKCAPSDQRNTSESNADEDARGGTVEEGEGRARAAVRAEGTCSDPSLAGGRLGAD